MKNISLYIPSIEDYFYQEKIQKDKETMSYNRGYDVNYYGYDYNTGCIDFPRDRWAKEYKRRIDENRYFAYIKDNDTNNYVGYVNYQYNKENNRYECGILIENKYRKKGYAKKALELLCDEAKNRGIKELYDNFEVDRGVLNLFLEVGFIIVEKTKWKKFNKDVEGYVVKKELYHKED